MEQSAVGDVGLEEVDTALGVVPDREAEALLYGRLLMHIPFTLQIVKAQPHMMIAGFQLQQSSLESRPKPSPADLILALALPGGVAAPNCS